METSAMNPDELMLWLSAKGTGTWGRYRSAVEELQLSDDTERSHEDLDEGVPESNGLPVHLRLKLNLERLGHVEFFRGNFPNGWRIVPPTLACDDAGSCGVLCGARTDSLLEKFESHAADVEFQRTEQCECPERIRFIASDLQELERFARSTGLLMQPRAASRLLAAIPPIDSDQMRSPAEMPFGKDWEVNEFDPVRLGWSSVSPSKARKSPNGLFRFKVHFKPEYYLRLRGKSFRVPVQVGKYVMLRKTRKRITKHDLANGVFSVPVSCRPPLLIDRALTICTGMIPEVEGGQLLYRNVDQNKAITANSLLRQ